MHEQRRDRGVHTTRQSTDHAPIADLGADSHDLLLNDRGGRPTAFAATYVFEKARQDLLPVGRVHDFGVELDAVDGTRLVLKRGDRRDRRGGELGEAGGGLLARVSMGHPARLLARQPNEQAAGRPDGQLSAPELAHLGALDDTAERMCEQLHSVTDAEHRDSEIEQGKIERRGARCVHRGRPSGKDQTGRSAARDLLGTDVGAEQLGEHTALPHAARDQLRILAAVVDDQHFVVAH